MEFIARGDLERMPATKVDAPRGFVRYSTPEVTAHELVGYPNHAGGLDNVATVLGELAEEVDAVKLLKAAELSPVGWSQRLGYLLEIVEHCMARACAMAAGCPGRTGPRDQSGDRRDVPHRQGPFDAWGEDEVSMVLEETYRFATRVLGPLNAVGDQEGCRVEDDRVLTPTGFKEEWKEL